MNVIGKQVKPAPGILLLLMWIGIFAEAMSQPVPDSLISPYDSLQDLRRKQWESRMESRLRGLDTTVGNNTASADSVRLLLSTLEESITELQRSRDFQEQMADSLARNLERAAASSAKYRKTLHRTLWITGGLFFLLLASSFFYLLLRSIKTRELLRKIRWKLRKDRKKLETRISRQERRLGKKMQSIRKKRSGKK